MDWLFLIVGGAFLVWLAAGTGIKKRDRLGPSRDFEEDYPS